MASGGGVGGAGAPPLIAVGLFIGVPYCVRGRRLFHLRYVAGVYGATKPLSFVIVTPDGDEYEEDYSDQNDIAEVVQAADYQSIVGVPAHEVYPFRADPPAGQRALWEATATVILTGAIPGLIGAPPPPLAVGGGAAAAPLVPPALDDTSCC
jgi:hypothetical protein